MKQTVHWKMKGVKIADSPSHELRKGFDDALQRLVVKLKTDEEFRRKGDEIKAFVQDNPELAKYARSLWAALRDWISNDLEADSSNLQQQVERMGQWLSQKLVEDQEMRTSINDHMVSLASSAAPEFADFLTRHIGDTVRRWDATDMSRQIELSIGSDLQYIRISGTAVGCCIGLLLFLVSHVNEMVR